MTRGRMIRRPYGAQGKTSLWSAVSRTSTFFHCTVSAIVTCLLMGDVPEEVAVMVIALEPTGVPGLLVPPLPLLLAAPQPVHHIVDSISVPSKHRRRRVPGTCLLLFATKMPRKPGRINA